MTVLLVAIGGAVGSIARYLLSSFVHRVVTPLFPFGTFAVNVLGCAVFGAIAGLAHERFLLRPETRAFLLIGVLGGFTTFSTFAFESFELEAMVGYGLIALERAEVLLYLPWR